MASSRNFESGSLIADPDAIQVAVTASDSDGVVYIPLGTENHFRLGCDEGTLPPNVVEKIATRLKTIKAGLQDLGFQPACKFPLSVRVLGGQKMTQTGTSSANVVSFTLDFDRDFELLDRAVTSHIVLGAAVPPSQWAWLVDGMLGSTIAQQMTRVDQFQMNSSTAAAIKAESRGAPRDKGGISVTTSNPLRSASKGAEASGRTFMQFLGLEKAGSSPGKEGSNAPKANGGTHGPGPSSRGGPIEAPGANPSGRDSKADAPRSPSAARASDTSHRPGSALPKNASRSERRKARKDEEADLSPLFSILGGPSAKNRPHYRLFTTSFVSFLIAMHPNMFPAAVIKEARADVTQSPQAKRDKEFWKKKGRLVANMKHSTITDLEREWRTWVEGRVDGRTRGIIWVFTHAFRLMGAYPGQIALSFLGLSCQLAMQAVLILSFAKVVDAALAKKEDELRKYVTLLAIFGVLSVIGSHCYAYIQSKVVTNTLRDLQVTMMRHLLAMPDSYLRDADEGSLLSYFANDINALEPTLASVFRVVQACSTFLLQVALMFTLDAKIAPLVILIQFLIIISQRTHNDGVAKASGDKQKSLSGVMSVVKEIVLGVTVIRDYGMADKAIAQFEGSLASSTEASFRLRMHSMLYVTAIICFNQCLQGATLSVLGYLALNDSISKGQVSAIYLNVTTLGSASATIVNMVPDITKGSGPLQRICAFMMIPEDEEIVQVERKAVLDVLFKEKQEKAKRAGNAPAGAPSFLDRLCCCCRWGARRSVEELRRAAEKARLLADEELGPLAGPLLGPGEERAPPRTVTGHLKDHRRRNQEGAEETELEGVLGERERVKEIECSDIGFAYRSFDSRLVIQHLSLTIRPCTSVCIVGGSGCGKSTLLGILMRNYRPTRGSIAYGGRRLHEIPRAAWKRHVRVVQQSAFIFADTVRMNIAIGKPGATEEDVVRAATLAQVHDVILELPEGYDTQISMKSLSGGQKQRVCIARALISEPKILVLDECTSALDAETERRINAMIKESSKKTTVIQVTHRLGAAEQCDEIIVLDKGRLVERGTYRELQKSGGPFSRLLAQEDEFDSPIGPARTLEQLAATIRKFRPFREGGSDAAVLLLAKSASVEQYKAGDVVCMQDTPASHFNLVMDGALVKERIALGGRREPLGTLRQGQHHDENNLLLVADSGAVLASAVAALAPRARGEDPKHGAEEQHWRQPWNHCNVVAQTDCRILALPLRAVNKYLQSLQGAQILEMFPHLESNRRAIFNWNRGRNAIKQEKFKYLASNPRAEQRRASLPPPPPPGPASGPAALEDVPPDRPSEEGERPRTAGEEPLPSLPVIPLLGRHPSYVPEPEAPLPLPDGTYRLPRRSRHGERAESYGGYSLFAIRSPGGSPQADRRVVRPAQGPPRGPSPSNKQFVIL